MSPPLSELLLKKAALSPRRIAFPDSTDQRTILAARIILKKEIAVPVLVGPTDAIASAAHEAGESVEGIEIIDPASSAERNSYIEELVAIRQSRGMTPEQAESLMQSPLFFSAMLARRNVVDGCVAGSVSTTGDVLRAGIQILGLAPGNSIASSFFLIIFPEQIFSFADCAVVPDPSPVELAEIALTTGVNHQRITGEEPRIAFLSFSTKGSADHPKVKKVQEAVRIARTRRGDITMDGELQLDAAISPGVSSMKAPGSPVGGKANVLIFPDLDSGNIGYKMAQRMGGAEAIGPLVQGLNRPFFDLSRGCSVSDIVLVTAVNVLIGGAD